MTEPAPLPPDLFEALADILAEALVASYLRAQGIDASAALRYRRVQPDRPGGTDEAEAVPHQEAS